MRIVLDCLWYLVNCFGHGIDVATRQNMLVEARRGTGRWVEAHLRMFLYSALERLYRHDNLAISLPVLHAAARYKDEPEYRATLYSLLSENTAWMGGHVRSIFPANIPAALASNNHVFDAFLCALTAWSQSLGECLTWQEAGITARDVSIEGHILVLRQEN